MLVSWVVRLVPEALAAGELVGEVERVASGDRESFRSAGELVDVCRRQLSSSALPPDVVVVDTTVIPLPRARGRASHRRGTP